jgi:hypothetical protein
MLQSRGRNRVHVQGKPRQPARIIKVVKETHALATRILDNCSSARDIAAQCETLSKHALGYLASIVLNFLSSVFIRAALEEIGHREPKFIAAFGQAMAVLDAASTDN